MEQMLGTILEEIKGIKMEVRETKTELRSEMQEMKTELRGEMQDMKTEILEVMDNKLEETKQELREETDRKIDKQTEEIANELRNIVIFLEKRDSKLEEKIDKSIEEQRVMLEEIKNIKIEQHIFDYRITKLECTQREREVQEMQTKLSNLDDCEVAEKEAQDNIRRERLLF